MSNQHTTGSLRLLSSRSALRSKREQAGFSLVELMVVFTIMTIALSMFSQTLTSASKLDPLSKQKTAAAEAAQNRIERMRGYDFADAFASFNADGDDDPLGIGTAPGNFFDIDELTPVAPATRCGEIIFCDIEGQIKEDTDLEEFGLPRDLSGDGIVDRLDHTNDCVIIPFKIVVRWESRYGERKFEMYGVLSNL